MASSVQSQLRNQGRAVVVPAWIAHDLRPGEFRASPPRRKAGDGANVGLVNLVGDDSTTDLGVMNLSDRSAVQLGILNITKRLDGIGLLNLAENGFLPVLLFFNFPAE